MSSLERTSLSGRYVTLHTLSSAHAERLERISTDPALWQFMSFGDLSRPEALRNWILQAEREPDTGIGLPFVIIDRASGQVAGSTSLYDIQMKHRRAELGRTWIGTAYQRTGLNTEAKILLLTYAFETLDLHRVQLKASAGNKNSRRAIERLGAQFEGTMRQFAVLPDGTVTDTALYSFIRPEWPVVKPRLLNLLR